MTLLDVRQSEINGCAAPLETGPHASAVPSIAVKSPAAARDCEQAREAGRRFCPATCIDPDLVARVQATLTSVTPERVS